MDGQFKLTREIVLDIFRCMDCSHWWACEKGTLSACPICTHRLVGEAIDREADAERSARSLRGVITRWKNRWRGLVEWEQRAGAGVTRQTLRTEMRRLERRSP